MSETHSEEISPEEARRILQSAIDFCEGKSTPEEGELGRLGLLFVEKWRVLAPVLVEMCGSEEAALIRVKQLKKLFEMGSAPTNTRQ